MGCIERSIQECIYIHIKVIHGVVQVIEKEVGKESEKKLTVDSRLRCGLNGFVPLKPGLQRDYRL